MVFGVVPVGAADPGEVYEAHLAFRREFVDEQRVPVVEVGAEVHQQDQRQAALIRRAEAPVAVGDFVGRLDVLVGRGDLTCGGHAHAFLRLGSLVLRVHYCGPMRSPILSSMSRASSGGAAADAWRACCTDSRPEQLVEARGRRGEAFRGGRRALLREDLLDREQCLGVEGGDSLGKAFDEGIEFLQRLGQRSAERDAPATLAVRDAQLIAISAWGIPDDTKLSRLAAIHQPVLVANGDHDEMVPTPNTHLLAEHLPNARLSIYPDAGHGFLFQYPVEFAAEVNAFLGR